MNLIESLTYHTKVPQSMKANHVKLHCVLNTYRC